MAVIPLSLIILVSEHINRRELRREVSTGLRYLGIGMLYLSSAADMFIAGAGESLWLPVILAVICVAGMFAGIMLRVRAFLFLGIGVPQPCTIAACASCLWLDGAEVTCALWI